MAKRTRGQKRSPRRRGNTKDDLFTTKISRSLANPPPVKNDLTATHRGEVVVTWTSATTPAAGLLSVLTLVNTLPGSSVTWDRVQFHKFDVWGIFQASSTVGSVEPIDEALPIQVTLNEPGASVDASDLPTFYADGVGTARRSHIGIVPNALYRRTWVATTSTNPLLTILTPPWFLSSVPMYQFEVLVQFTCVLRSVTGATAPTVSSEAAARERFAPKRELKPPAVAPGVSAVAGAVV